MELLTGRARTDFEDWYLQSGIHYDKMTIFDTGKLNRFYNLPDIYIYSCIVSWFDSVDIYVNALRYGYKMWCCIAVYQFKAHCSNREDAMKKSIIEANRIYNEKSKESSRGSG